MRFSIFSKIYDECLTSSDTSQRTISTWRINYSITIRYYNIYITFYVFKYGSLKGLSSTCVQAIIESTTQTTCYVQNVIAFKLQCVKTYEIVTLNLWTRSVMETAGIVFPLKSNSTRLPAAAWDKQLVGTLDKSLFDKSNLWKFFIVLRYNRNDKRRMNMIVQNAVVITSQLTVKLSNCQPSSSVCCLIGPQKLMLTFRGTPLLASQ